MFQVIQLYRVNSTRIHVALCYTTQLTDPALDLCAVQSAKTYIHVLIVNILRSFLLILLKQKLETERLERYPITDEMFRHSFDLQQRVSHRSATERHQGLQLTQCKRRL